MFKCKKLFKLQIRPPSLILLITTSQDRWIISSQSWELRNPMMMMMMMIIIIIIVWLLFKNRHSFDKCWNTETYIGSHFPGLKWAGGGEAVPSLHPKARLKRVELLILLCAVLCIVSVAYTYLIYFTITTRITKYCPSNTIHYKVLSEQHNTFILKIETIQTIFV